MENQTLGTYFQQFNEAAVKAGQAIEENLIPAFQRLIPVMQAVYDTIWRTYREAGAPYGETADGLLRWVREVGEAKRLQFEAERILQYHQVLADFRQRLKEKSASEADHAYDIGLPGLPR